MKTFNKQGLENDYKQLSNLEKQYKVSGDSIAVLVDVVGNMSALFDAADKMEEADLKELEVFIGKQSLELDLAVGKVLDAFPEQEGKEAAYKLTSSIRQSFENIKKQLSSKVHERLSNLEFENEKKDATETINLLKRLFPAESVEFHHGQHGGSPTKRLILYFNDGKLYEAVKTAFDKYRHPLSAVSGRPSTLDLSLDRLKLLSSDECEAIRKTISVKSPSDKKLTGEDYYQKGLKVESELLAKKNAASESVREQQKIAVELYKKAVDLGHVKAKTNLAYFYVKGEGGLSVNKQAAISLLTDAAKEGHERAKTNLAVLCSGHASPSKHIQESAPAQTDLKKATPFQAMSTLSSTLYSTGRACQNAKETNDLRFKQALEKVKEIAVEITSRSSGEFKGEQYRVRGNFNTIKSILDKRNIRCIQAEKGDDKFLVIMQQDISNLDKNKLDALILNLDPKQKSAEHENIQTKKLS